MQQAEGLAERVGAGCFEGCTVMRNPGLYKTMCTVGFHFRAAGFSGYQLYLPTGTFGSHSNWQPV